MVWCLVHILKWKNIFFSRIRKGKKGMRNMIYEKYSEVIRIPMLMDYLRKRELDWMLECLEMNPDYTGWGNGKEMMEYGDWWNGSLDVETVDELIELDQLNELPYFYFYLEVDEDLLNHSLRVEVKEDIVRLGLQMWILHPRKCTGRGMRVLRIEKNEVNEVVKYLYEAEELINERFERLSY